MLNSSSAFRPCVARTVPWMTLREMQTVVSFEDDRIHGFGTLVLPVCRINSPNLATVLTYVCRLWRCCSTPPPNDIHAECWVLTLIHDNSRLQPSHEQYEAHCIWREIRLFSFEILVAFPLPSIPTTITNVSRLGYSWRFVQSFSLSLSSYVFGASLFNTFTLPKIPDIPLTRWSKKWRASQSNVVHPSWSVIF